MKTFSTVLTCLGLICAASQALAQVEQQRTTNVHVAAGDLGDAVESLGKQAGVNVLYPGDLLNGRTTAGVDGTLSSTEAFARLLEGTSLTFTEEHGAIRIAKALTHEPAAAGMVMQGEVPMAYKWERRQLKYSRPYDQRRVEVERTLKRLGARDVEGTHTQATSLVLVPASSGGQGTLDSSSVAVRWEKVTFRVERGIQRYADGVSPIVFEELKDILRLFVTRNLDEKVRNSVSVEVLYPVTDPAT